MSVLLRKRACGIYFCLYQYCVLIEMILRRTLITKDHGSRVSDLPQIHP